MSHLALVPFYLHIKYHSAYLHALLPLLHPVQDYSLQSSSLVFLNTERMVERSTVVVRIREDSTPEQDPPIESFRVVLSSSAGGGMQPAVVFSVPEMEVHIRDNDY